MERSVRYELLPSEEEDQPAQTVEVAEVTSVTDAPSPIASLELIETPGPMPVLNAPPAEGAEGHIPETNIPEPPSYSIATTLPTYEEAEETKKRMDEEEEARKLEGEQTPGNVRECQTTTDIELGTDGMFLCTFVFAFLFNWIGLFASLCLSQTIAGRMGALAGFGLSMVKWVAIVKHKNWASGVAEGDSWIWWMLIIMGLLIFFRGCMQYIRIKYQWNRLAQLRDRVYLYF